MTREKPVGPSADHEPRGRIAAASLVAEGRSADLILVLLVVALRLVLAYDPLDDAFLLLAVVRNLLGGGGPHLAFGGGDAALSTLAWPALVALPAALGVALPQALAAAGVAAEVVAALLVRRLALALSGSPLAALFAATAFATQPVYLLATLGGMETSLYCAALALAAWASLRERDALFALAVGLIAWTRVEGLGLALLLLFVDARRRSSATERRSLGPLLAGAALALAAPLAHRLLFGEWLPATLAAKAAVDEASVAGAARVGLEMLRAPLGLSAYWLVVPSVHALFALCALVGLARLVRDRELWWRAAPAVVPGLGHAALFIVSGRAYATNFPWYFAPPLVAVAVLTAIGAAPWASKIERRRGRSRPFLLPLIAACCALAAAPSLFSGFARVRESFTAHRERAYAAATIWLTDRGDAGSLASNEVGTLAYFAAPGTTIVDLFGISRSRATRGLPWLELIDRERPAAIVSRIDFRYRRVLEVERPDRYVWARFGALDLGLEPALAERLEPLSADLRRLFFTIDLWRQPRAAADVASSSVAAP